MIYKLGEIPGDIIDRWRTGNYGEDYYNEEDSNYIADCDNCTSEIYKDDTYYDIDGVYLCENCSDVATEIIFEKEKYKYRIN